MKKHQNRSSASHKQKEQEFQKCLEDLFDLAHADALVLMKNPEDQDFLVAKRQKGKPGCIGSVHMIQFRKDKISLKRSEQAARRWKMVQEQQEASTSQAVLVASSLSSVGEETDGDREKEGAVWGAATVSVPK